jgi:hypothetical protein
MSVSSQLMADRSTTPFLHNSSGHAIASRLSVAESVINEASDSSLDRPFQNLFDDRMRSHDIRLRPVQGFHVLDRAHERHD